MQTREEFELKNTGGPDILRWKIFMLICLCKGMIYAGKLWMWSPVQECECVNSKDRLNIGQSIIVIQNIHVVKPVSINK